MPSSLNFDWSKGKAFVQDGTIFYSPNCSRTVVIPPNATQHSPFMNNHLEAKDLTQPVWWSDVYGWIGFIPLGPSFTSTPFEPFCWMPRIVEVAHSVDATGRRETRFEMHPDDCRIWSEREQLLIEAAERIRIWYKIPGTMPPPPSKFDYKRRHKSRNVAKRIIASAREWFGVWMGFLSYLIAYSKLLYPSSSSLYTRPEPDSPFPVWYHRLYEVHHYPAAWLDGLNSSTVCSYDEKTPRIGVVFEWSKAERNRPSIEWFLEHNVPVWFKWTREEEQAILRDRTLLYFRPPDEMIEDALAQLFHAPTTRLPLASLIIRRYYNMGSNPVTNETVRLLNFKESPTFVLNYTTKLFLSEDVSGFAVDMGTDDAIQSILNSVRESQSIASLQEADVPKQSMIERSDEQGRLFNHWQEFFSNRKRRQEEMIRVENATERQKRLARERNPGIRHADIYTWEKIRSSGGKNVYMRLRVTKKRNEEVFVDYRPKHRIYNAIANEWDLCEEFGAEDSSGNISMDSGEESDGTDWDDDVISLGSQNGSPRGEWHAHDSIASTDWPERGEDVTAYSQSSASPYPVGRSYSPDVASRRMLTRPNAARDQETISDDTDVEKEPSPSFSQNVVASLSLGYGYVSSIHAAAHSPSEPVGKKDWETILVMLGFVSPLEELEVDQVEKRSISIFFDALVKKKVIPMALDDLHPENHAAVQHLFDFAAIHRPSSDLFVFSEPRSTACNWLLGVNSSQYALYIIRYILSNPGAHTIVTVASRLLTRGIPFRTLLGLDSGHRQSTVKTPYNPLSYRLANHVFTLQDYESAMLKCQTVLSQPHGRAALLRGGILWRIAKQFLSEDGVLSGPSIETTSHRLGFFQYSGTRGVQYCDDEVTEDEVATICGTYSMYTAFGQITVKSWFPPPSCWTKDRTGANWVEWTARNEKFFNDLLKDIDSGKHTPLTVSEWGSKLRGFKTARILRDNNNVRAKEVMEKLVPVSERG